MKVNLRQVILFVLLLPPFLMIGQQATTSNTGCPGVPGACGYHNISSNTQRVAGPINPNPQNGNGTLGNIYAQTKCGLNWTQASQRLGQRFTPVGVAQPAPFVISGIPSCAVIEKAFLWAEGSGNGAAQTATVNGPAGSANYAMAIVGQGPDKCWGYSGSYTYRADVTPSVNGNGTYNISGILTNPPTSGNDMDGATLIVIWSDPTQTYRGTIRIDDGAIVVNGGVSNYNMTYPAVCGPTTNAQAFCAIGDVQFAVTSLTLNGTNAPFAWNWWNFVSVGTTISAGQTTSNFNCNTAGDCFNFCVAGIYYRETCVTCTPSSSLVLSTTFTPSTCSACNGTATVTVTSGTGPFTYSWSPSGGSGSTATGLCPGTYTVTVNAPCGTATATVTIPTTGGGLTLSGTQTNVSCFGGCNATASTTVTGGTGPYTFTWSPAHASSTVSNVNTASGLCAGTYTISVTDANGCTGSRTITITEPPALTVTPSQTNISCNGGCNGTATCTVGGGTPGYSYSWAPSGGSGSTASSLCVGTYTCTITDANGCTITQTFSITQPPALTATQSQVNITCNGSCNGSATVVPSGGTPGYSYAWAPSGGSGSTATGLCVGTYTCTITDANGCSITKTFTITQPPALTATTSQVNLVCNGICNGSATVVPSGGTPGYSYSWAPSGGSGSTATALCAGTYTCTITDANGCTITKTFTITQPPALSIVPTQTDVSCNGGCNGTATSTVSGGTPPYTYAWAPSGGNGSTATGLCAGTYTCTVTDANGCTLTQTFTITQPTAITATFTVVTATCGNANGSATVVPSGGTPTYTYSWNTVPVQTTATATNISAGTYNCVITDANLCTFTITVIVPNAGSPTAVIGAAFTNVTCFGACDGTATCTASGGTPPYTYAWTPSGGSGSTATGLCPGTYTCTVTDANGCIATDTVLITEPPQLTATTTQVDVLCNGNTTGSATVSPAGGTPGYTYLWTPSSQTTATATNLGAGAYTVLVTDLNGCSITLTVTITEPTPLTVAAAGFNVTCNGVCDGQVVCIPAGGTPNYTFSWNPTTCTTASCNNICAGTYVVTVTDMNGCTATGSATVTQPPAIVVTTTTVDAHCNQADGSATATISGGTGTLTPTWYPGAVVGNTLSNVVAGNYYVVVVDQNGCDDTAFVTINNLPGVLSNLVSVTPVSCNGGNNGQIICNATSGTSPYLYSWSCSPSATTTASGLSAGTCTFTVTDAAGCQDTTIVTVTQPPALTLTATANPAAVCAGTGIQLSCTAGGGTPGYNYVWNPGTMVGQTQNIVPTASGTYTVYIADANSCTDSATVSITVNANPVALLAGDSLSGCAPLCVNFSDLSTLANGTITQWAWDFGDGSPISTQQNPNHCYNTPGAYTVILTVTTSTGCTSTVTMNNYINVYSNPTAAFSASPQPTTELNPTIYFTDLSSNAFSWSWDFGDSASAPSNVQNPTYTYDGGPRCYNVVLTVTTVNGCIDTTVHQICIDPDVAIFVPNAFTPNDDGVNDNFYPQGIGIDPDKYEMWIFDRWGNLIFYTDDWNKQWNGKVQGGADLCQIDVYVWKIKCYDLLGNRHNMIGHVSLIR